MGAGFGNLVLYCLGVGKWVLFWAQDEIRLCQESRPPCLLPSPLEAYWRQRGLTFHLVLSRSPYRFSPLLLSLHLTLYHLLWLSCSPTPHPHPPVNPLNPPATLSFTRLHYATIKAILILLQLLIILWHYFIIGISLCAHPWGHLLSHSLTIVRTQQRNDETVLRLCCNWRPGWSNHVWNYSHSDSLLSAALVCLRVIPC